MKREKYIDVAKGFGILLVVYGHVISNCDLRPDLTLIQKFIYSFHMPLFFFISGYCLGLRKDTGEKPAFLPPTAFMMTLPSVRQVRTSLPSPFSVASSLTMELKCSRVQSPALTVS